MNILRQLAPLALLAASAPFGAAQESPLPSLFEPILTTPNTRFHYEDAPLWQVNVEVQRELFFGAEAGQAPAPEVTVDLFDGDLLTARYQGTEVAFGGGYIVSYSIGESPYDSLTLSCFDEAISGSIRLGHQVFALGNLGGGVVTLSELDPAAQVQAEAVPMPGWESGSLSEATGGKLEATKAASDRVDLLVVYLPAVTAMEGGHDGVASLMNYSVYRMNKALAMGDSKGSVNLVGLHEDPTYVASGAGASIYLWDLQGTGDGLLDDAHVLRDDLGADSVLLLYNGYSGIGYVNCAGDSSFGPNAFSVAGNTQLVPSSLLEQLVGFHLGAAVPSSPQACSLAPYQFGYASANYRSILGPVGNTTLPMFSNPDLKDPDGLPMGDPASADAARRISEMLPSVAALRASVTDAHELHTTFLSNNGSAGNTFDLKPKTDISISSMDINLGSAVGTAAVVELWYRDGTWVGNEHSSLGWTLLDTKIVASAGIDTPTFVNFLYVDNTVLKAGQTYGMMVLADSNVIRYTNGAEHYENSFVRLESGAGIAPGGFGAGTFPDRIWNGVLYYDVGKGEHDLETTTSGFVKTFTGNMFDLEALSDVTINGFEVNTTAPAGSPVTVDIWYRVGGYSGYEQSPWEWTYLGSDPLTTSAGQGSLTSVAVGDIQLTAGTKYGFYVRVSDGSKIVYSVGHETYANSDLVLTTGVGLGGDNPFSIPVVDRTWNGAVRYTPTQTSPHLAVPELPFGFAQFELSNCTPGGTVLTSYSVVGNGPIPTPWGVGALSLPYVPFATATIDGNGRGLFLAFVPAGLSGLPIWFQGLDVGSWTLTNGVATVLK